MISRALSWLKRRLHKAEQQRLLYAGAALKTLLFHGVYDDSKGTCPIEVDADLCTSLSHIENAVLETREQGFRFIHADELPHAMTSKERLALLTFDDGYANNLLLSPLLSRLQVPTIVFITTSALVTGRCYWWDVLARCEKKLSLHSARRRELKALPPSLIEERLMSDYGSDCFHPKGDHDRPMTAAELCAFSRNPYISIGNHTHKHALLDQLSEDEAREELSSCADILREITGSIPCTLAYPNGRRNADTLRVAAELGIKHAFTTERRISSLPTKQPLNLPRLQP